MKQNKQLSVETIKQWLTDDDYDVRAAAMNACQGKDIPLDIIKQGLSDDDFGVRTAAMNACRNNGIELPIVRTIEPPKTVYKKCLNNVIVCAEIPLNAQVRGSAGSKCRANKAIITDIIGDIIGESVGISTYDLKTTYFVGDTVEVDNFDYSDAECSTGFHFFCTIEEAKRY